MAVELKVPAAGESITEVEVGEWLKHPGDPVEMDEIVVVLESDKAALELPSPAKGILARVLLETGTAAKPGDVLGIVAEAEGSGSGVQGSGRPEERAAAPAPAAEQREPAPMPVEERREAAPAPTVSRAPAASPVEERPEAAPAPTVERREPAAAPAPAAPAPAAEGTEAAPAPVAVVAEAEPAGTRREAVPPPEARPAAPRPAAHPLSREEQVVPMTALRRRIAERLVQAQQSAALLTTFNEIDMSAVMALRKDLQPAFQERYDVKLGFMSFFVKASIEALKLVPGVNGEIRDDSIVYRNYYDIGIAVGGGRGLVVPVLRNAERMSFAEIEQAIGDFAARARDNKLKVEELQGGTFTISNGGVYGSLLSTPIINPPQSGVLGMHAIQDRPVARDGQVVIRPMMYVALTYDHRIVDGREAVTFLRRIKECVEEPTRLLLEV